MQLVQLDRRRKPGLILAHIQQDQIEPAAPDIFVQKCAAGVEKDEFQTHPFVQRSKAVKELGIFLPVAAAQCDVTDHITRKTSCF